MSKRNCLKWMERCVLEESSSVYSVRECGIALLEQGSWNCIKEEMRLLCSKVLLRGAVILKTQKAIEASWANSNFSKKQTAATPVLQIRKYLFSRVLRDFVGGKNKM